MRKNTQSNIKMNQKKPLHNKEHRMANKPVKIVFNFISYQGNAKQNHNVTPPSTHKDG